MNHSTSRKGRLRLLQRRGFWAVAPSLLALGLVISVVLAGSPVGAEPMLLQPFVVDIALDPCPNTVQVGETFTLDVYVQPNGQQVDAVDADLTFKPIHLEVLSVTGDPAALPDELFSDYNNTAGTLTHSRGILSGTPPNTAFRLCSIEFKAKAPPGTAVEFTDLTNAYFQGGSVLRGTTNCLVTIPSPPVGGVGYLLNPAQVLAPGMAMLTVIAGLILGTVVVLRKVRRVA